LRNLGLVRRVSGVPTGILENVSLNDRRCDAIGIAGPDERPDNFVLFRNRAQLSQRFGFRFRFRQMELSIQPNIFRNSGIDQRIEIVVANFAQHFADLGRIWTNVTIGKSEFPELARLHAKRLRNAGRASSAVAALIQRRLISCREFRSRCS
jgi:hypothetical protein